MFCARFRSTESALMINSSTPLPGEQTETQAVEAIVLAGPGGAMWVAGIATFIVVALWVAFYVFVFAPRGAVP